MLGNCFQKIKGLKMATMHELFDGSDAQELCSGTAETALRGAEDSNPQRVGALQSDKAQIEVFKRSEEIGMAKKTKKGTNRRT